MQTTETQPTPLPWTGERYVPELSGQIELEHVHRYLLAQEYAQGKDVLDIACGEGYGTAMLAKVARSAIGVDIDQSTVTHASARYKLANVRFEQGSCLKIPIEDSSVDLVVSFETIEHIEDHKSMLSEIKRVLRPGGTLIISTPDKQEYSVAHEYQNPFHVLELYRHEFQALVQAFFAHHSILGQQIIYGSAILPDASEAKLLNYHIKDTSRPTQGIPNARYFIAIASDHALPQATGGLLEQEITKYEAFEHAQKVSAYLEEQLQSKTSEFVHLQQLHQRLAESETRLERIRLELGAKLEKTQIDLSTQLEKAQFENRGMKNSLSWKLTRPLRALNDLISGSRGNSGKTSP